MKTFFLIEAGRALQIVAFRPAITTVLFQRFSVSFSCSYFTCCTSQLLRENWLFKFLTAFDHVIRASNDLSTMRFMIMYIYVYIYIYTVLRKRLSCYMLILWGWIYFTDNIGFARNICFTITFRATCVFVSVGCLSFSHKDLKRVKKLV